MYQKIFEACIFTYDEFGCPGVTLWGKQNFIKVSCGISVSQYTWLNLKNIKDSPSCAACLVACAPPSVHITPIVGQPCWLQPKLEIPGFACRCLNALPSPHSC